MEEEKEAEKRKSSALKLILIMVVVLLVVAGGGYYFFLQTKMRSFPDTVFPSPMPTKPQETLLIPQFSSQFATYEEVEVEINPQVEPYQVGPGLTNVINAVDFSYLSEEAKSLLAENAFAVTPGYNDEFFGIYESNRYAYIPNFVTTDSILHHYHLMFDHLLRRLEEEKLAAALKELNGKMLVQALSQHEELQGTEWENAAKRNVGFFSVGSKLLEPTIKVPEVMKNELEEELSLIEAHQGIQKSPVMNIGADEETIMMTPQGPQVLEALKEDYSQYIPRGHYDKTELLKAYFKAMMWYGRITFRFKNEEEIKSALLITLALNQGDNKNIWNNLFEPINFFVGKADDIGYYQFKDLVEEVYGPLATLTTVTGNHEKLTVFLEKTKELEPPQINSMPIFEARFQPDREKEIKGFRFMGQRFTIDASIFQRLLYREVGDKTRSCPEYKPEEASCLAGARCLPKGLDVTAAMGSEEALNILETQGELEYACYPENMTRMKEYIKGIGTDIWTQNLYWGWLYALRPLTEEKEEGYPTFMRNLAWIRKDLNTYLGSWTELKHDTILYAKQAYAEMGAGGEGPKEKDDRGWVEPNVYVYARLAALLKMTKEGLEGRGLLGEENKENLGKMEELVLALKTISEKELNGKPLTEEEYELIRSYGGQLEHFWMEVNKEDMEATGLYGSQFLHENPAAIVADVATDPNGFVLEEGTGNIFPIYVVVPVEGELRIAKGGVYSYYEFPWEMSDRLTDKKWRELLLSEEAPARPEWTETFIVGE